MTVTSALAAAPQHDPGPLGEIRRGPAGQVAVAATRIDDLGRPAGQGWKLVGDDPQPGLYGWRTSWDVARWEIVGNVFTLPSGPGQANGAGR